MSASTIPLDIVLYLTDLRYLSRVALERWRGAVNTIFVVAAGEAPVSMPNFVNWVQRGPKETRCEAWNRTYRMAGAPYVLFLEDDENFDISFLPDLNNLSPESLFPVHIRARDDKMQRHYVQLRFLPRGELFSDVNPFEGYFVPDASRFVFDKDLQMRDFVMELERTKPPFSEVDLDEELSVSRVAAQAILMMGYRDFDEGKFVPAIAMFRSLLKRDKVLTFDRLAAINGMAGCAAEQHKWPVAIDLVRQSLEAEPRQYLPYLIRFRIYQLGKEWSRAFGALQEYQAFAERPTCACFDLGMTHELLLYSMADMAFKAGMRVESFRCYEQIYKLYSGKVDFKYHKLLFYFAIELSDFDKAVFYFDEKFREFLPDKIDKADVPEMEEWLSMFMEKGWYDFATNVYEIMYSFDPQNPDFRAHLVAGLTKSRRLDQAKHLFMMHKKR
jgi:tetratricopeptide (TPR) repeat protein